MKIKIRKPKETHIDREPNYGLWGLAIAFGISSVANFIWRLFQ